MFVKIAPSCHSDILFQWIDPQVGAIEIVKVTEEHYTIVWIFL